MKGKLRTKVLVGLLVLVAICICSEARAATYISLTIDWDGDPQDEIIDHVVVIFKDNGGQSVLAGELFFEADGVDFSIWSNTFNIPSTAVSVEWFIDPGDDFNPWGDEVPLPTAGFSTVYEP